METNLECAIAESGGPFRLSGDLISYRYEVQGQGAFDATGETLPAVKSYQGARFNGGAVARKPRRARAAALVGLLGLSAGLPALAHHSFAMFDHQNRITVAGTVVKFEWTNPHVYIHLDVPDGPAMKEYTVECASPNVLMRNGWKFNVLKQGDKVTLLINPLRSGQPGGLLETATLSDGRALSDGNPPAVLPR